MKFKWLYHESSNAMAMLDESRGGLPLMVICDDDIHMISPFYSYPFSFLIFCGWIEIGEL